MHSSYPFHPHRQRTVHFRIDRSYFNIIHDGNDHCHGNGKPRAQHIEATEQFVLPDYQRAMLVKAGLSVPFIDEVEEKIHG